MRVGVELIAIASRHGRRSLSLELPDGATAEDLLEGLDLPDDESYMTLVNGYAVAPGRRAATRLADGDKVIVFPPLKGG